jgi:hypothetical protein
MLSECEAEKALELAKAAELTLDTARALHTLGRVLGEQAGAFGGYRTLS